ncbi:putative ammonium transporter 1 isoform X1 [Mytilus galloprovincialis]|uniref:putative ammonium transporter 1 isoform X1 n=1 Tax=Mytilus galloprovincialis TaxID=29158 RepID=UPI003F7C09BF
MSSIQAITNQVLELEKLLNSSRARLDLIEHNSNASIQWQHNTEENADIFFLIMMANTIFLMQGGFAFLEAGSVRSKNTTNILIKNLLDAFISGISYWMVGYAFGFGDGNAFIGYSGFALSGVEGSSYAYWFFQYVFAATAATIVSGAVAERCDFVAYLVYSSCITGFIYPVLTHWAWSSDGWLAVGFTDGPIEITYSDFAGSGIVHCAGGVAAFVAAAVMGPRIGRFDKETGNPVDIKGHSVPFAALGGFILLFGFLAFNGSSHGAISSAGDGVAVATAVKNTVLGGTGGAFLTLTLNRLKWIGDSTWSFLTTLNGCLAGMVAVCASCNQITTYGAFIIGIIGGVMYMITTWTILKLKVDDPLDATAVHFGGGVWGVIACALFSTEFGVLYHWDKRSALQLAWQLAGLSAIITWTATLSFVMFYTLKKVSLLRVSFEFEMKGLDIPKHGEPAYPAESYGHGWGETGDALGSMVEKLRNKSPTINTKTSGSPEVDSLNKLNSSVSTINTMVQNGSTETVPEKQEQTKI